LCFNFPPERKAPKRCASFSMELNHRIQDKFSADKPSLHVDQVDGTTREIDFIEVEKAIKDFCFIRQELTNYSYLYASQLSFDIHLNLPYWEYLFISGQINQSDKDEIEEGVLLTIYLFFSEIFEAEGWCFLYRHNLFEVISKTLKKYQPDNERKKKALDCIKFSLDNYGNEKLSQQFFGELNSSDKKLSEQLKNNDEWFYFEFVEKYYIDKANSFEPLKQKTKAFLDDVLKRQEK